jgi:uncharacterized SAM-binding protein YcdF (DUF218 family)|tara:strand:- start:517 stop:1281 length:765 start_codon:yes stop_codon:yes gene_type:complete
MDLFLLKKIITMFLMPINIILLLLILSLIFYKNKPKAGFKLLILATFILFITSMPPISDTLMAPIEDNYETFSRSAKQVDYIVVLGCSHTTDYALPATSQLKTCSLQRLVEAIRISRLHPEARLIMSGYSGDDAVPNAEKMRQAAMSLGIKDKNIITESFPKDTEEEAVLIAPRVIGTNVVLITNANHMPRAINYFERQGVSPIAAPTGYWVKDIEGDKAWNYYLPSANKLSQTTTVWYETLGRIVQWFKSLYR